jgi:hypothetical protein
MHARAILFAVLVSSAGGCYATGGGYGYGTTGYVTAPTVQAQVDVAPVQATVDTSVQVQSPELATIAPDVQVIVDADEPIFFSDGHYWRETNGAWYRSTVHTGGWGYYAGAPYALRSLDRRDSYRRYRPAGYVSRRYDRGYDRGYTRNYDNRGTRGYDNRNYNNRTVRDNRNYDNRGTRGYDNRGTRGYDNRNYNNRTVRDHRNYDNRGTRSYDNRGTRSYDNRGTRSYDRGNTTRDHRSSRSRDNRGSYRRR